MNKHKDILKEISEGKLSAEQGIKKIEELDRISQITYTRSVWIQKTLKPFGTEYTSREIIVIDNPNRYREFEILNRNYKNVKLINKEIFTDGLCDAFIEKMDKKRDIIYFWYSKEDLQYSFNLLKAIAKYKIKSNLIFLANDLCGNEILYFEAMESLLKSIHMEAPFLSAKILNITSANTENVESIIIKEFQNNSGDVCIKYGFNRQIKCNEELVLTGSEENHDVLNSGTYVITGGMGELGKLFAKYLMEKFNAKVILLGRRILSEVADDLKQLKIFGDCEYYSFDIEQEDEWEEFMNNIIQIEGIFHCAGVLNDKLLINKSFDDFQKVIASKVNGTLCINQIVKKYNIPFLVLFSSISAVIGNVGQCDYAYGNGFMNCLAMNNTESQKVISISWPLWEHGGMTIDSSAKDLMKKKFGFDLLDNRNGIKSFLKILNCGFPQVSVFKGDKTFLFDVFGVNKAKKLTTNKQTYTVDNLKNQIKVYLKKIIEEVTKIQSSQIDDNVAFDTFGMDSITAMKINDKLEETFGELPKSLMYEYMNIESLADYFLTHYSKKFEELFIPTSIKKIHSEKIPNTINIKGTVSTTEIREKDVAIIGISGRYPKASNLEEFWENLLNGVDCIEEIPVERWDNSRYYSEKKEIGKINSKWGGFLKNIDKFDPLFFHISPREASVMDPQEKIFLETAWEVIEDAGYKQSEISKRTVGVFVGAMNSNYQEIPAAVNGKELAHASVLSSIANRVSFHLNLHGPSITLDTMCSSSLTALHLACVSLKNKECEIAIAGGVSVITHPNKYLYLSQGDFLDKTGRCRAFGEGGDGYVPSEGSGAVLLKSLKQAIEDGDQIYGVIKGHAINHGGKTSGYTVPNPNAQAKVIKAALKEAEVLPEDITYIETHGTGTALGDPIEIAGLEKAYGENLEKKCPIGSVKSNIGHTESAAGIASLTKVLLQMKYSKLVPSLHSTRLNKNINFRKIRYYVQQDLEEWTGRKTAAISSFGAGGSNSAVIIQEYIEPNYTDKKDMTYFFPVSAQNQGQLLVYIEKIRDFLKRNLDNTKIRISDVAYTMLVGRENMPSKIVFLAATKEELIEKMDMFLVNNHIGEGIIIFNNNGDDMIEKLLFKGDDGKDLVDKIIRNGNIEKIALLWFLNLQIDYSTIYKDKSYKRISLPTYPFEKIRCWLPQEFAEQSTDHIYVKNRAYENLSDLNGVKYRVTLAMLGEIKSFLKPQVISQSILLEVLKRICDEQNIANNFSVSDLEFGNPNNFLLSSAHIYADIRNCIDGIKFEFSDPTKFILMRGKIITDDKAFNIESDSNEFKVVADFETKFNNYFNNLGISITTQDINISDAYIKDNEIMVRFNSPIALYSKVFWDSIILVNNFLKKNNRIYFIEKIGRICKFAKQDKIEKLYIRIIKEEKENMYDIWCENINKEKLVAGIKLKGIC